jgi:regulator of RNase E activity RraA
MTTTPSTAATPLVTLPVRGPDYQRADPTLVERLKAVSAATASATLHASGISRTWITGPTALEFGHHVVGSALTLQFMPKREDITDDGLGQESVERRTALWKVLEAVQPGDILVVQAYGSAYTGCLGDMLVRYFKRRGGAGIVVDGRIRDSGRVRHLGVPIWCTGRTPNYASQCELFPWAYDVPVAVGGALCLPGDYVIADDDGAVIVPQQQAVNLADSALDHEEWESFSRMRIDEGARLSDYYPLTSDSREEFEVWVAGQQ